MAIGNEFRSGLDSECLGFRVPHPEQPPDKLYHPLSYIEKRYNMERLLNHHSVKTPPRHHGGDSAHSSSLKHQQTNEREKDHITTKEQARIIENNICLFFDPSLKPNTTKPPKNGSKPFKSIAAGDLKPGDTSDTIALKRKVEQMASSGGVRLARYRADKEEVAKKGLSVLEKKKSSDQSQNGSKPSKSADKEEVA